MQAIYRIKSRQSRLQRKGGCVISRLSCILAICAFIQPLLAQCIAPVAQNLLRYDLSSDQLAGFASATFQSGKFVHPPEPTIQSSYVVNVSIGCPFFLASAAPTVPCYEPTPYLYWAQQTFGRSNVQDVALIAALWGASADPDGDGKTNFTEFVLGTNPLQSDNLASIINLWPESISGEHYLSALLQVPRSDSGASVSPYFSVALAQDSEDLTTWHGMNSSVQLVQRTSISELYDQVHLRDTSPLVSTNSGFLALQISREQEFNPLMTVSGIDESKLVALDYPIELTGWASSTQECVAFIILTIDGSIVSQSQGDWTSYIWTPQGNGESTIVLTSLDREGFSKSERLDHVRKDGRPVIESVDISSDSNFHSNSHLMIRVSAHDPEEGALTYQFLLEDSLQQAFAATSATQFEVTDPGLRLVVTDVKDMWGLKSRAVKPVQIFRTPPLPNF